VAEYEMSGKAISVYNGELHAVQGGNGIGWQFLHGRKEYVSIASSPGPHEALTRHLTAGTRLPTRRRTNSEGEEVS